MLEDSGTLTSEGPRTTGSLGMREVWTLHRQQGLLPAPGAATVWPFRLDSDAESCFSRMKSHFHECPLVPEYKSCISVNCWSWILKHGNAEGSPEDRDPALTTGIARLGEVCPQPVTSKSHCQSLATRTEQIQHLKPQLLVSLPEVQWQRIGRRHSLRDGGSMSDLPQVGVAVMERGTWCDTGFLKLRGQPRTSDLYTQVQTPKAR